MINFFRRIRQQLLTENKTGKYFKYAIGEIVLVVIGILIALSINNWNEQRKEAALMITNIKSIAKDILNDSHNMERIIKSLQSQEEAGRELIPIMESDQWFISDSLAFIMAFNDFTSTPIISQQNNTWDYLNSSGTISEFPDEHLLKMLQDYYSGFHSLLTNYSSTGIPVRLEIRKLKYELFTDTEHRKFFPTKSPRVPNKEVYDAIFDDERVLPLCRYISSTATYFGQKFKSSQSEAENIVQYIESNYTQ